MEEEKTIEEMALYFIAPDTDERKVRREENCIRELIMNLGKRLA